MRTNALMCMWLMRAFGARGFSYDFVPPSEIYEIDVPAVTIGFGIGTIHTHWLG